MDFAEKIKKLFLNRRIFHSVRIDPSQPVKRTKHTIQFPSPVGIDEQTYVGSFDFDWSTAQQLRPILGEQSFAQLMQPVNDRFFQFYMDKDLYLNVRVSLPEKETLIENEKEIYLPLNVKDFLTL